MNVARRGRSHSSHVDFEKLYKSCSAVDMTICVRFCTQDCKISVFRTPLQAVEPQAPASPLEHDARTG